MSGVRSLYRGPAQRGPATASSAPVRVDDTVSTIFINQAGTGTTEQEVVPEAQFATITGDGAIPLVPGKTLLTKGSAAAITIAAPGTAMIGKKITIVAGSDFAHVVTFTGSTLKDGTTGAKITWTSAAFIGSAITIMAVSATQWVVVNKNLGTVA